MKHTIKLLSASVAAMALCAHTYADKLPEEGYCSALLQSIVDSNGGADDCVTAGTYTDASGATRDALLLDGIPIAFRYDEYWSYSAPLLQSMVDQGVLDDSYGPYDFSTGVGTLDVVIFTQAGGTDNQDVGVTGSYDFEDPYASTTGAGSGPDPDREQPLPEGDGDDKYFFEAYWGAGDQDKEWYYDNEATGGVNPTPDSDGPVTVGDVLGYLQEFDPDNTTPVFYVDWNQAGSADSLFANALVQIVDPETGEVVEFWSLDTGMNDGVWEPEAQTYNFGSIQFLADGAACASDPWNPLDGEGCAGVSTNGLNYPLNTSNTLDHNKGSGHADFIFFAPDMDLAAIVDTYGEDYLFVITANVGCDVHGLIANPLEVAGGADPIYTTQGCNTNGAEEMFMTGRFGQDFRTPIPGTLLLTGAGLLLLGRVRKARA